MSSIDLHQRPGRRRSQGSDCSVRMYRSSPPLGAVSRGGGGHSVRSTLIDIVTSRKPT